MPTTARFLVTKRKVNILKIFAPNLLRLPINWDKRKWAEQKYGQSSNQCADDEAQFYWSSAIAQVTPNRTGYAVGPVLQTKEDSNVKWRQVKLKIKQLLFSKSRNKIWLRNFYRSQHLRFQINWEKSVRHGRYDESEERYPNGRNAQNSKGGAFCRFSFVILRH